MRVSEIFEELPFTDEQRNQLYNAYREDGLNGIASELSVMKGSSGKLPSPDKISEIINDLKDKGLVNNPNALQELSKAEATTLLESLKKDTTGAATSRLEKFFRPDDVAGSYLDYVKATAKGEDEPLSTGDDIYKAIYPRSFEAGQSGKANFLKPVQDAMSLPGRALNWVVDKPIAGLEGRDPASMSDYRGAKDAGLVGSLTSGILTDWTLPLQTLAGIGIAKHGLKGLTTAPTIGKLAGIGAKTGAASGALSGVGEIPDDGLSKEGLLSTGIQTGLGAGIGALAPVVGTKLSKLVNSKRHPVDSKRITSYKERNYEIPGATRPVGPDDGNVQFFMKDYKPITINEAEYPLAAISSNPRSAFIAEEAALAKSPKYGKPIRESLRKVDENNRKIAKQYFGADTRISQAHGAPIIDYGEDLAKLLKIAENVDKAVGKTDMTMGLDNMFSNTGRINPKADIDKVFKNSTFIKELTKEIRDELHPEYADILLKDLRKIMGNRYIARDIDALDIGGFYKQIQPGGDLSSSFDAIMGNEIGGKIKQSFRHQARIQDKLPGEEAFNVSFTNSLRTDAPKSIGAFATGKNPTRRYNVGRELIRNKTGSATPWRMEDNYIPSLFGPQIEKTLPAFTQPIFRGGPRKSIADLFKDRKDEP